MAQKENQKIDSLLTRFYREEVDNVELPDSQRCWQSFQKMLEKAEHEGTISSVSDRSDRKIHAPRFGFIKKYRNLTALAAACLLVVMVLSGMPPVQNLRQILTGAQPKMDAGAPMIMGAEETEEEPMIMLEKSPSQPPPLQPPPASEEMAPRDSAQLEIAGMEDKPEVFILADTLELTFDTLERYSNALQVHRDMTPGKLFYLDAPPEGYSFSKGIITKADTNLLMISQTFTGTYGDQLTMQQTFIETPGIRADEPSGEDEEIPMISGYGEPGYEYSMLPGSNILQWPQADSVITLNGQLDEDELLTIANRLISLD